MDLIPSVVDQFIAAPEHARHDLQTSPWVVIWEVTQACQLACRHCRASAQPHRHPLELSTAEGKRLLEEVARLNPAVLVLTGGDPLERDDIYELVGHAAALGLEVAFTPSGTPLLTPAAISRLQSSGVRRLALSLDGASAATHDDFRGVGGSFAITLQAAQAAARLSLPVQINTTATRRNRAELPALRAVLDTLQIAMWSVFFLIPTGRAQRGEMLSADETEELFAFLYQTGARGQYLVRTTEAPHYRRYLRQARHGSGSADPAQRWARRAVPRGIGDGSGFVFISHTGEIYPSGFLPISAGNVRYHRLGEVYRHAPLFQALRDRERLKGKCGVCEYRHLCGGSRARAYALTGDYLAADSGCNYQPRAAARKAVSAADISVT